MEFFDWSILGTLAGSVAAVAVITEITKSLPGISKIPTQIWSYVLALVVLICAQAFTAGLTASSTVLALVNAGRWSALRQTAATRRFRGLRASPRRNRPTRRNNNGVIA